MLSLYPLFVPFAPLIAASMTALPASHSQGRNFKLGFWVIFSGFVSSLILLWQMIQNPEPINIVLLNTSWDVLPVVQFTIDRLTAVMMAVIAGFSTLLYLYSARYLQQDGAQGRYQTLLALKASLQIFMVASADLITLFAFWQVLGWLLTLLTHNYAHAPTSKGAFRIFITLRAGDLAFLAGIVLAYHIYGTVQFTELFERAAMNQTSFAFLGTGFVIPAATLVTLLIFIGAMCKSAQFPVHMWLSDSLYAPTPVSALLHAGGINSGGFLLTRLAPLFVLSPTTLHIALVIGLVTAVIGSAMMLVQNDIKKTLAYSTMGQMGYMIMECGLGAFSLAIFHLVAHGLFKANAFLNCGKGIHEARMHPTPAPKALSGKTVAQDFGWFSAFALSFIAPLIIALGVHYLLGISFTDHQGLFILMLFSWITVSQAVVTLFRLKKSLFTKTTALCITALVAFVYFFAAEKFTHFLIPDPSTVDLYLTAAELPYSLFLMIATTLVLSIVAVWIFSLNHQGKASPGAIKVSSYLFLMNRLYLDAFVLKLLESFKRIGRKINNSFLVFAFVVVLALGLASEQVSGLGDLPVKTIFLLVLSAMLIPLFPFHTLYLSMLTKAPRKLARLLCAFSPALGLYIMIFLLAEIPRGFLPAISVLAIFGAAWGSIKALMQDRVAYLLSYGGLALYSVFWWYIAQVGSLDSRALFYAVTLSLSWAGLYLAWDRIHARYGNLSLQEIGGLFQVMPRFSVCLVLLVTVAVGLSPFSLFFGFLGILLSPAIGISYGLLAIILTWFFACWYLFKLMQGLLFGTHRKDIYYEDLGSFELMVFLIIVALLIVPSAISQNYLAEVIL